MDKGECETIISFSKTDKEANIWTNDIKIIRKIKKLGISENNKNIFLFLLTGFIYINRESILKNKKRLLRIFYMKLILKLEIRSN